MHSATIIQLIVIFGSLIGGVAASRHDYLKDIVPQPKPTTVEEAGTFDNILDTHDAVIG